jgi:hypothetical protein
MLNKLLCLILDIIVGNGKYYPSITYVLQYYPKGKFFEDWLKKVGYASEHIVRKAERARYRNTRDD